MYMWDVFLHFSLSLIYTKTYLQAISVESNANAMASSIKVCCISVFFWFVEQG